MSSMRWDPKYQVMVEVPDVGRVKADIRETLSKSGKQQLDSFYFFGFCSVQNAVEPQRRRTDLVEEIFFTDLSIKTALQSDEGRLEQGFDGIPGFE